MQHLWLDSFSYALIPSAFLILGALFASYFKVGTYVKALIQHFASGVVFAAVSVELIPQLITGEASWTILWGFLLGVFVVLGLHALAHKIKASKWRTKIPYSLTASIGIDLFLDGLLIGIAFLAGQQTGVLIALSLSACAFFLAFTLILRLREKKASVLAQTGMTAVLFCLLPLGALVGATIGYLLPPEWFFEILAFGVAALLYLALEELFLESHEEQHGGWGCASFFIGFLLILLLKIA